MHITAELVAKVVLFGLVGIGLAYFIALFVVWQRAASIVQGKPGLSYLVPDRSLATGRTMPLVMAWWSWTSSYRRLGDSGLSAAVVVSRVLCVATVLGWAALFLGPRDFAERAEAWANGKVYSPAP